MLMAPATNPATPASNSVLREEPAAAIPMIRLAVETMPSLAPSTAARSQPMRWVWRCSGLARTRSCGFIRCGLLGCGLLLARRRFGARLRGLIRLDPLLGCQLACQLPNQLVWHLIELRQAHAAFAHVQARSRVFRPLRAEPVG